MFSSSSTCMLSKMLIRSSVVVGEILELAVEEARENGANELDEADAQCHGPDNDKVVAGDPIHSIDTTRVPDVAGMITDAAISARSDAARVRDFVVPPSG